jgi:hypothetical protein
MTVVERNSVEAGAAQIMAPQDQPPRYRALRIALLIAGPVLALLAWHAVQPDDRLVPEAGRYYLTALIYDEYDLAAMAQRGLNAEIGRQPGATSNAPWLRSSAFSLLVEAPRPLRPRYFLEYPHAALLIFRAGYWIQPHWRDVEMPPGLPDARYHNIAEHNPETNDQFAAWRVFVVATQFYAGVMFVAWVLLIAVLEWGYTPELRGGALLLLLPGMAFFILNRYDVLPALATALAFAALGRRRPGWAGVALGIAALLKVYPVLFAPLVVRYLWSDRRAAVRFAGAFAATGLLALLPLLEGTDWVGLWAPYKFQLTRPPEHGLTIYGCLVPVDLAEGTLGMVFRLTALAAFSGLMLLTPIRDLTSLLRRCAVVLIVFVTLAVFYSPQWIIWFAPLLPPLVRRERAIGVAAAVLDLINYLTFPVWWWVLPAVLEDNVSELAGETILVQCGNALRLARFICCAYLTWRLLRAEYPWRAWYAHLQLRFRSVLFAKSSQ